MHSPAAGMGFLLVFALTQGVQDAFFGNIFQTVSFWIVAVLAFTSGSVCFSLIAICRRPGQLNRLMQFKARLWWLNLSTALAWLSFFFALKHLEPAVVATLYNGVGPLVVLALQTSGYLRSPPRPPDRVETLGYLGMGVALSGLVLVVLSRQSGLPATNTAAHMAALGAAIAGGVMITLSHLAARRLNELDIGSDALMGSRFWLVIVFALGIQSYHGWSAEAGIEITDLSGLAILTAISFTLITVPSYSLQLGIARASPLAVNVVRALAPVFVFAVQQLDGRLHFSGASLSCILAFCAFAVVASIARMSRE